MPENPTAETVENAYMVRIAGPGLVLERQVDAETVHRIASLLILPGTGARRGRPPGGTRASA